MASYSVRPQFWLKTPFLGLLCVLAIESFLVFYGLTDKALWNDEAFSFFGSYRGVHPTLYFIAHDTHPPFYYLVLSLWLHLGHSVLILRSLSAIATIAVIAPLYFTTKQLFGPSVALIAILLFATDPYCVAWAQKARPYSFQTMLVALSFWGFVQVFLAKEARTRFIGSQFVRGLKLQPGDYMVDVGWICFSVCGALAMLTQHPAGFFVLACNCAVAVSILRDWRNSRILLINWVLAQFILILVWLLWFPEFINQVSQHLTPQKIADGHANFIVDIWWVLHSILNLLSVSSLWRAQLPFSLLFFSVAVFSVFRLRKGGAKFLAIAAPIFVPLAVCLVGYFALHPVFGYVIGTLNWILIPYSILLAFGIAQLPSNAARMVVLGVMLFGNTLGLRNYYAEKTPPLDAVAEIIRHSLKPDDGIILDKWGAMRFGIAYYLGPPYGSQLAGLDVTRWDNSGLIHTAAEAIKHDREWVILPSESTPRVSLEQLVGRMKLSFHDTIGDIDVYRFEVKERKGR